MESEAAVKLAQRIDEQLHRKAWQSVLIPLCRALLACRERLDATAAMLDWVYQRRNKLKEIEPGVPEMKKHVEEAVAALAQADEVIGESE